MAIDPRRTITMPPLLEQPIERLVPDIPFLSINIAEFEQATYSNKSLIDPRVQLPAEVPFAFPLTQHSLIY